jgi:hypothetical protein
MPRLDPTNRILAVIDDPPDGERAMQRMIEAGIPPRDVTLLAGAPGADRIDAAGRLGGRWLRIKRLVALTQADQSVDLATYEAALRDGRSVLAVRAPEPARATVLEALRESGAHFTNYYGRLMTQELLPWRGERLPLPPFLQR